MALRLPESLRVFRAAARVLADAGRNAGSNVSLEFAEPRLFQTSNRFRHFGNPQQAYLSNIERKPSEINRIINQYPLNNRRFQLFTLF